MYRYLHILLVFLPLGIFAQWTPSVNNIIQRNYRVWSIKIAPDRSAWALARIDGQPANNTPQVYRSTNEWQSWSVRPVSPAFSERAWDISPLNNLYVYVAAGNTGLLRTIDGGLSWESVSSFPYFAGYVHFFSGAEGVVFGSDTTGRNSLGISCTADSGRTWTHLGYNMGTPLGTSMPDTFSVPASQYSSSSNYSG